MVEPVEITIYSVVVISISSITTTKRTYWTAPKLARFLRSHEEDEMPIVTPRLHFVSATPIAAFLSANAQFYFYFYIKQCIPVSEAGHENPCVVRNFPLFVLVSLPQ